MALPETTLGLGVRNGSMAYAIRVRGNATGGAGAVSDVVSVSADRDDFVARIRRDLGMKRGERFVMSEEVPMLYGSTVSLDVPKWEGRHPVVRDTREILQHAGWKAGDTVREQATSFFGCDLQDIAVWGSSIERMRETVHEVSVSVLHLCGPEWEEGEDEEYTPLPLLLARIVGKREQPEGIVWVDEERTMVVCRRQHIMREVRTVAVGMRDIRTSVSLEIECEEEEVAALFSKWENGTLSPRLVRLLCSASGEATELLNGAIGDILHSISDEDRPVRAVIAGLVPAVVKHILLLPRRSVPLRQVDSFGEGGGEQWARAVLEQAASELFRVRNAQHDARVGIKMRA